MSMFDAMNTAGSSLHVYRTWLDAVSDNISNLNTAKPTNQAAFQERMVVATSVPSTDGSGIGHGAAVAGVTFGDPNGRVVNDPSNPLADAQGNVRMPDIDMGEQMVHMMVAERGYQANLATIDRAKDMYQSALDLGK
jgi:flagellar basal-body rod protein FlgC